MKWSVKSKFGAELGFVEADDREGALREARRGTRWPATGVGDVARIYMGEAAISDAAPAMIESMTAILGDGPAAALAAEGRAAPAHGMRRSRWQPSERPTSPPLRPQPTARRGPPAAVIDQGRSQMETLTESFRRIGLSEEESELATGARPVQGSSETLAEVQEPRRERVMLRENNEAPRSLAESMAVIIGAAAEARQQERGQ